METDGYIDKKQALALVTSNIEKIFGLEAGSDLVAYRGGQYSDLEGVAVAVISEKGGYVDLM